MFEAILKDERRHMRYTRDLLVDITGSERAARKELRKAALWEMWRTWRRGGRAVAERLYVVLMIAFSLLLAPFALVVRLTRPAKTGWAPVRPQALHSPFGQVQR